MASFCQQRRIKRDKKLLEMAALVKDTFEPLLKLSGSSDIDLFIQIIQTDGGMLTCAINAACLALVDAGIPMSDYVVACSAGFVSNQCILDLNYIEEGPIPCVSLAIQPKSGKTVMMSVILGNVDGGAATPR